MRSPARDTFGLRPITMEPSFTQNPAGSCLVKMGKTWVLCTACIEENVPPFLEGKNTGWVTAEYAMLPGATHTRTRRESTQGKQQGRSQEIQRLIGRALRACINTKALGPRSIFVDCDVLQADGGTRTAAINGAFVALAMAVQVLQKKGVIASSPIHSAVAAVSVGMKNGEVMVDLDYGEDSNCDVDMNFVMLNNHRIVEMQGTAERNSFTAEDSQTMLKAAGHAIGRILELQKSTLERSAG